MVKKEKAPAKSSKAASSMEELLRRTGYSFSGLSRRQKVEGKVIAITSKALILDIGAKSEGLVEGAEFEIARSFITQQKVGDKVQAVVLVPETEAGHVLLSVRDAAEEAAWKILEDAKKNDEPVEVKVESKTQAGLSVLISGLAGFIPNSHLGRILAANSQSAVGRTIQAKVIELDEGGRRVVLSEKAVSEAETIKEQAKALTKIKKGERLRGRVVNLTDFGVFVQIEKDGTALDGLVHLSELAWEKVESPSSVVKEGDEVEVVVIGKEKGKLALSIKQAKEDPWATASKKYKAETGVRGEVSKIGDFGAIIKLEPGVEGLLHLSKIPPGKVLHEGDSVECFIEIVDAKNRKISLSLVLKEKPIGYK